MQMNNIKKESNAVLERSASMAKAPADFTAEEFEKTVIVEDEGSGDE